MFDLPVLSPQERKRATEFRNYLLDEGFTMSQYSVYWRFVGNREKTNAMAKRISKKVPLHGKVSILCFTDKQFGTIQTFYNARPEDLPDKPEQLMLF